jgi:maltose-binding protein MalE
MKLNRKKVIIAVGCCLITGVLVAGSSVIGVSLKKNVKNGVISGTKSVTLWYTDSEMKDYLGSAAKAYEKEYHVQVLPVQKSGKEFLQAVNKASLQGGADMPDLYFITNDALEQATLAGLSSPVQDDGKVLNTANFPQSALSAVTYHGQKVAYPVYYDTSVLIYNKNYLEDYAEEMLQAESDKTDGEEAQKEAETETAAAGTTTAGTTTAGSAAADGESASSGTDASFSKEQIQKEAQKYIPATITDLENFADEYDAPQKVQSVFKWDVSDILENYGLIGNYMNIGGENGDDSSQIDIYNENTIRCLQAFQKLSQFFSIDASAVSKEGVVQDFENGKIVFMIADADAVQELETAKADGTMPYEYGTAKLPGLSEKLQSRPLSVTGTLVVNGYSEEKVQANEFAAFLTTKYCNELYPAAGKISGNLQASLPYETMGTYREEYAASEPIPKMMSTSNLWMKMSVGLIHIWNGSDPNAEWKSISESAVSQITGKPYTEKEIQVETETQSTQANDGGGNN